MAKRKTKRAESFSDQLRRIIEASEMSRNELCRAAGVDPSHLHKFVHRTGRLTNDTIDRLADVLGIQVTTRN